MLPGVSVRWASLSPRPQQSPLTAEWRSSLAPSDAVRLRAVRHPRQHALSVLAVVLLRLEAAGALGVEPLEVPLRWECPGCGAPDHGRPLVDGVVGVGGVGGGAPLGVSVAHAGDLAVVAMSTAGPVGVDVEVVPDGQDPADLRSWVRSEAALKATGEGLAGDAAASQAACAVHDLALAPAPPGVVAALALLR